MVRVPQGEVRTRGAIVAATCTMRGHLDTPAWQRKGGGGSIQSNILFRGYPAHTNLGAATSAFQKTGAALQRTTLVWLAGWLERMSSTSLGRVGLTATFSNLSLDSSQSDADADQFRPGSRWPPDRPRASQAANPWLVVLGVSPQG